MRRSVFTATESPWWSCRKVWSLLGGVRGPRESVRGILRGFRLVVDERH